MLVCDSGWTSEALECSTANKKNAVLQCWIQLRLRHAHCTPQSTLGPVGTSLTGYSQHDYPVRGHKAHPLLADDGITGASHAEAGSSNRACQSHNVELKNLAVKPGGWKKTAGSSLDIIRHLRALAEGPFFIVGEILVLISLSISDSYLPRGGRVRHKIPPMATATCNTFNVSGPSTGNLCVH